VNGRVVAAARRSDGRRAATIPAPPVVLIALVIGLCGRALATQITIATTDVAGAARRLETTLHAVLTVAQAIRAGFPTFANASPLPLSSTPAVTAARWQFLQRVGILVQEQGLPVVLMSKIQQALDIISDWLGGLTAAQRRRCNDEHERLLRLMKEISEKMTAGGSKAEELVRLVSEILDALNALVSCLGIRNPFGGGPN
jgi:hypothetical protein